MTCCNLSAGFSVSACQSSKTLNGFVFPHEKCSLPAHHHALCIWNASDTITSQLWRQCLVLFIHLFLFFYILRICGKPLPKRCPDIVNINVGQHQRRLYFPETSSADDRFTHRMNCGAVCSSVLIVQTFWILQGAVSGSVQASDRLMKELREIYRSQSYKTGEYTAPRPACFKSQRIERPQIDALSLLFTTSHT